MERIITSTPNDVLRNDPYSKPKGYAKTVARATNPASVLQKKKKNDDTLGKAKEPLPPYPQIQIWWTVGLQETP